MALCGPPRPHQHTPDLPPPCALVSRLLLANKNHIPPPHTTPHHPHSLAILTNKQYTTDQLSRNSIVTRIIYDSYPISYLLDS